MAIARQRLAAVLAASLLLSGCSGGMAGSGTGNPGAAPEASTANPTTAPPSSDYFASALTFTRLVHLGKHSQARSLVEPNSPAARYIAHQLADTKAYKVDGLSDSNVENDWTIAGDEETGKVRIKPSDGSASYTWEQFTYSGAGKITGWTGASGPIESALWTRGSSDTGLGVTARLVSAYRTNIGAMRMVVDYSTDRDVDLSFTASYAARGGSRQNSTEQSFANELDKGKKTFTHYSFADATFGGTLRLKVASMNGSETANLVLAIR
ncbi:MAG TPA: hypothetical protein VLJ88_12875 [Propionibacteriaceae bacterium]|nr:hypothetical protein [Propionibacteriaceae bacterium]